MTGDSRAHKAKAFTPLEHLGHQYYVCRRVERVSALKTARMLAKRPTEPNWQATVTMAEDWQFGKEIPFSGFLRIIPIVRPVAWTIFLE